jgi:hypothetical protein
MIDALTTRLGSTRSQDEHPRVVVGRVEVVDHRHVAAWRL